MQYQIDKTSGAQADGVVLVPDTKPDQNTVVIGLVFGVVGAVMGAVGLLDLLGKMKINSNGQEPMGLILSTFGAEFVAAALLTWIRSRRQSRGMPRQLVFSNTRKTLEMHVVLPSGLNKSATLPYSALKGFHMRSIRRSTSSSSTGTTKYYYVYTVQLVRADGGTWQLMESRDEAFVQDTMEYLRTHVRLEPSAGDASPPPALTPDTGRFKVQPDKDGEVIVWDTDSSWFTSLLTLVMVGGFGTMTWVIHEQLPGPLVVLPYLFMGIAALMAWAMFRPGARHFEIQIGSTSLVARHPGVFGNRVHELPLREIETVVFHVGDSDKASQLMILRAEERQALEGMWQGDMSGVSWDNLKLVQKALVLNAKDLNVIEMLALEGMVERRVQARRGEAVR